MLFKDLKLEFANKFIYITARFYRKGKQVQYEYDSGECWTIGDYWDGWNVSKYKVDVERGCVHVELIMC